MGLPLIAIPESMTPSLATILSEGGLSVEVRPVDGRDDPERFLMCLICSDNDSSLALSVQHEPHVNSTGPVIVIGPPPKGYPSGIPGELSNRIVEILQDHGAWIATRETAP